MNEIRRYIVSPEEDGIRLDRWFKIHFPQVTFAYLNKLTRTGQIRVQGGAPKPARDCKPIRKFASRLSCLIAGPPTFQKVMCSP